MISDSTYFLMNGAIAASTIPSNVTLVVNGSGVSLPSTVPANAIVLNGTSGVMTSPIGTPINTMSNSVSADVERPFVCDVCGTRYKSKPGLNYHRAHAHVSETTQNNKQIQQQAQVSAASLTAAYNEFLANGPSGSVPASVAAVVASVASSSGILTNSSLNSVSAVPNTVNNVAELRPYTCDACGAKYKSKPGLNYHRLHVHLEPPKNQSMVTETAYTELLKTQPGITSAATVAENALALASAVATTSASDADRPYICEVCGAKYKSKPGLAYHRSRTHQDEKPQPFICPTCGASYKSKPGLAYHRIHAHPEMAGSTFTPKNS